MKKTRKKKSIGGIMGGRIGLRAMQDLINENESPEENDIIDRLKEILEKWRKPTYMGGGLEVCERAAQYDLDIEELVEEFTDPDFVPSDRSGQMSDEELDDLMTKGDIQEQKLRKIIRKMIRE